MPVVVSVAQGGTGSNSSANALSAIGGAPLAAYAQANAAYAQANSAYGAANNAVLKAGDTMTGQLNISSGGLLVTGNVGIGTTGPGTKLDILTGANGGLRVSDGSQFGIMYASGLGGIAVGTTSNHPYLFLSNNTERMRLDANGNLGIGTTTPTSSPNTKLHIREDDSTDYRARAVVQATDQKLVIASYWQAGVDQYSFLQGYNDAENGTHKLLLNPFGGSVGINVTSPASQFHVNSATEWGIRLRYANDTTTNRATFLSQRARGSLTSPTAVTTGTIIGGIEGAGYTGSAYTSGFDGGGAIKFFAESNWASANTPTYIAFYTNPTGSAGYTERMRIRGSGGLAINNSLSVSHGLTVTRPSGGLERSFYVDNDGRTTARFDDNGMSQNLYLRNLAMTTAGHGVSIIAYINEDGTDAFGGALRFGAETDYSVARNSYISFAVSSSGNDTEAMRINSTKEVFIAGSGDQGAYNLQVFGTGIWAQGAYVNGSDSRIKKNIQPLGSTLDVVMAINPIKYQYKEENSIDDSVQPGFTAQDLQSAMVGKDYLEGVVREGSEYLNVAYQNMIPILTKAMQEQQALIQALTARVAELENK